jgi:hypothetical protein
LNPSGVLKAWHKVSLQHFSLGILSLAFGCNVTSLLASEGDCSQWKEQRLVVSKYNKIHICSFGSHARSVRNRVLVEHKIFLKFIDDVNTSSLGTRCVSRHGHPRHMSRTTNANLPLFYMINDIYMMNDTSSTKTNADLRHVVGS